MLIDIYNRLYIFYARENVFLYAYNFLPFLDFPHVLSVFFRRDVRCTTQDMLVKKSGESSSRNIVSIKAY